MSSSTYNYAGIGILVADVVRSLKTKISISPVMTDDLDPEAAFVFLNDRFAALAKASGFTQKSWSCPSVESMLANGYLDAEVEFRNACSDLSSFLPNDGPNAFFTRTVLMASGLRDPSFYESQIVTLADDHSVNWSIAASEQAKIKIFPCGILPIKVRGKSCKGLAMARGALVPILKSYAAQGKLNILNPLKAREAVVVPCLKSALNDLLKLHEKIAESDEDYDKKRYKASAIELWMHKLIDGYLESRECFCDIRIQSSYMGHLMNKGMKAAVPYVTFGRGLTVYGEDGWNDPREDKDEDGCKPPSRLILARDLLLGPNAEGDWMKLLPKFIS
jgi:hypothetical protein